MKKIAFAVAVAGLMLGGCDAGPADGAGDTIVQPETSDGAPDAPTDPPADAPIETDDDAGDVAPEDPSALGTRGNPAPIGATATIGDWDVTILDVDTDATARILEENQFNDPPADGRSFVMWEVEATYMGTESGTAWIDLDWKIVGSEGNSFGSGMDDSCGVAPNDLFNKGETFPGGVVTGNVCIAAETAQLDGGTILVEELFGGSRTFFAVP